MQAAPVQAHTETLQDSVLTQKVALNSGLHEETRHLGQKVGKAMGLACLRSCRPVDPCHGLGILPVVLYWLWQAEVWQHPGGQSSSSPNYIQHIQMAVGARVLKSKEVTIWRHKCQLPWLDQLIYSLPQP